MISERFLHVGLLPVVVLLSLFVLLWVCWRLATLKTPSKHPNESNDMYKQRLVDARLQAEQDLEAGAINIQYQTRNSMHNVKTTTLRISDERRRAMGLTTSSATTMRNLERFEQESRAKSNRGSGGSGSGSSDHKEQQEQQQQQQQRRIDRTVTRDLYDRSLISQVKHGKGPAYEQFKERIESLYIVDRGGDGGEQQQKRKTQKSSCSNSNHQPPKLKKWSKMKVEKRLEEKKLEDTVEYWRRMSRPDGIEPTRQSIYDQSVQQRQQQELSW